PHAEPVAVAAKQPHHGQADGAGAVGRSRSKHAVRARIAGRRTQQFVTLVVTLVITLAMILAMEKPKNVEMRKPFDVLQARPKFRKDFEKALFLMLRPQPARDLVRF